MPSAAEKAHREHVAELRAQLRRVIDDALAEGEPAHPYRRLLERIATHNPGGCGHPSAEACLGAIQAEARTLLERR